MNMQTNIEDKISKAFEGDFFSVEDESHKHSGGFESHYKIVIVSNQFEGKRPVARHQMIYRILQEELAGSVHALALHTYSTKEWADKGEAPLSPNCMGGGKNN